MRICISILLLFLLVLGEGTGAQPNGQVGEETVSKSVPNPVNLQPDWIGYFDVNNVLEERIRDVEALLESYILQIENGEEKQEAQKKTKELLSHLETLHTLKTQEIAEPSLAWLPRASYNLEDYLQISDQIHDIDFEINYQNIDFQIFQNSAKDLRQAMNNAYATYLTSSKLSTDKFLQGLEVMALGSRLLYFEAEVALAKRLIERGKQLKSRYQSEKDLVEDKLVLEVNLGQIEEEKEKLNKEILLVHNGLLALEGESLQSRGANNNGQDYSRINNQKLTYLLIKSELIHAKRFFLEAKSTLFKTQHNPEEVNYSIDLEPIKAFVNNARSKLASWDKVVSAEISQLSQALVKINGETSTVERRGSYEESLKLSLSNKGLLDALSKELYHINLVLGLINTNALEGQSFYYQIAFSLSSIWQWFVESYGKWFYYSFFEIEGAPITLIGILKAALIFLVSFWISKLPGRAIRKYSQGKGRYFENNVYTFRRMMQYLILFIGVLFSLASLGLTVRNMAIVLGALGIGIGFGLQNIVNNFLCGLAILFEKNVKIGDFVELETGCFGRITEVKVQNTTLHTFDGLDVLVPNSSIIGSNVINWTKKDPYQRIHIPFGVAYGSDAAFVSKVVCEAAQKVPYTITGNFAVKDPEVWMVEFGESSLNFELVVWVNIFKSRGRNAMKSAYLTQIHLAFIEHGIHIPFPQRDLYVKTLPDNRS